MFCPNCGHNVKASMTFCEKCGSRLDSSANNCLTPQNTKNTIIINNPPPAQAVKSTTPLIKKSTLANAGLSLLLIAIYVGISFIFILLINMKDTILIETAYDASQQSYMTLKEFLDFLISGNRIFNPTFISSILAISTYLLVYSVPVFAVIGILATILRKKQVAFHAVFSVMIALASITVAIIIPLSAILIPELRQAISISVGVIFEDINQFSSNTLIIFAIISLILLVLSGVITALLNKRRSKQ